MRFVLMSESFRHVEPAGVSERLGRVDFPRSRPAYSEAHEPGSACGSSAEALYLVAHHQRGEAALTVLSLPEELTQRLCAGPRRWTLDCLYVRRGMPPSAEPPTPSVVRETMGALRDVSSPTASGASTRAPTMSPTMTAATRCQGTIWGVSASMRSAKAARKANAAARISASGTSTSVPGPTATERWSPPFPAPRNSPP